MKTLCRALLLVLAGFCAPLAAQPAENAAEIFEQAAASIDQYGERILSYDSEVQVNADGSLDVTEQIKLRAEGSNIRRGIYRDFPTRYKDRYGNNVVVDFRMVDVLRDGNKEPWFTEDLSNGVRINTGNDNFLTVPAEYSYRISYRTTRQLGFFADHDELYWNAIGTGWSFPIASGSVTVRLPQPVATAQMQAEGYTGAQGEQGTAFTAELPEAGVARWALTQALQPQEGFTIVLSFPKGIVTAPTQKQRMLWLLRDNSRIWFSLIALLGMLGYCYRSWKQVGRDPQKGVVITRYEPPAGYSPAGLRYVRNMGYDSRCFSADVLALAVAGKLRINRDKSFFSDAWSLQKLAGDGHATAPEAELLLSKLFAPGTDRLALERSNHRIVAGAEGAHKGALFSRFDTVMFSRNGGQIGIAAAIGFGGLVLATIIGNGAEFLFPLMALLMIVVLVVFGRLVKAPTVAGQKLLEEIEGFARYLKVAERAELDRLPGPGAPAPVLDASRYEKLLPYAVALEVEEAWTEKFTAAVGDVAAAAAASNLGWYHGGSISNLGSFSSSIGSSLSSQISSAGTAPGSSSGRGGGGSSGGGGGGGGGGGR